MIERYQTINPATGCVIESYPTLSTSQLDRVLTELSEGQKKWGKTSIDERIKCIRNIRQLLLDHVENYAQLITDEMGKTLVEARAEVQKCTTLCDYYVENAKAFLAPEPIHCDGVNAERVLKPLGLIYAIMPWNFPFWQVLRAVIPNLLLGNAIVLKHVENVIGCGYALESLVQEATKGMACHVFKNIVIDLSLSEYVIKHEVVAAVTLTGSNRAGSVVAKHAGEVCKKSLMELGGSDAYIIRADVDVDEVAKEIVQVRMANAGQVCISPKRLIVDASIKEAFEAAVVKYVSRVHVDNPNDSSTVMGPLAREDLRDNLHMQVMKCESEGATLLTGGKKLEHLGGTYYAPTVLSNVTSEMTAFKEELFGSGDFHYRITQR